MTIKVGDHLPNATVKQITKDGFQDADTQNLFKGKTIALFGLVGAFTPPCSNVHLPSFAKNMDEFKRKGIEVVCVAVNDPFALAAWGKLEISHPDIIFLADWSAEFSKAMGLTFDGSKNGLGIRSKRYNMLVKDGVVAIFNLEEDSGVCTVSAAETLLKAL
ncbi:MAG: peroxiredoxin [Alphaproteobacteria bacterium]|jgi:peroxiredoxin|nr:peroxiredoxin [Alphaproteobacteria bacterium]